MPAGYPTPAAAQPPRALPEEPGEEAAALPSPRWWLCRSMYLGDRILHPGRERGREPVGRVALGGRARHGQVVGAREACRLERVEGGQCPEDDGPPEVQLVVAAEDQRHDRRTG